MPRVWYESIQNRQGLGLLQHSPTELRRAGCSQYRDVQPFYFANHTIQASVTSYNLDNCAMMADAFLLAWNQTNYFHECVPLTQGSWHFLLALMNPIKSQAETLSSVKRVPPIPISIWTHPLTLVSMHHVSTDYNIPHFSCMWLPRHQYFRRIP